MVKPATSRATKYASKYDPAAITLRFTATKDLATQEQAIQAGAQVQMETSVKSVLEAPGSPVVSPTDIPQYLAFARQCYARARKYGGAILTAEITNFANTWHMRGLDSATLVAVAALFGATIVAPTP